MKEKPILFSTEMVRAILDGRKTVTRRVVKPQPEMHMFGDREALAWIPPAIIKGYLAVGVQYTEYLKRPYNVGDILWVRETWAPLYADDNSTEAVGYLYKTDPDCQTMEDYDRKYPAGKDWTWEGRWRPSIHMPREAARIFLRVTDVRVERLQEITVDGINSEGVDVEPPPICRKGDPTERERAAFAKLTVQKQDEYISTLARHTYMGWCKYADDLFVAWKNLWDSTIKPADRDRYGWAANPWVWVIAFERTERPMSGE